MTIFDELRSDHDTQRTMAERLLTTEGASGDRTEIYKSFRSALHAHAGAEERFFYVPLMDHDVTQEHARHSVAEHKELDDFLEQLDDYDMSSSQWLLTARELVDRLNHHLDEEEREVFPVAGKLLDNTAKAALASEYREDMDRRIDGDRQKLT